MMPNPDEQAPKQRENVEPRRERVDPESGEVVEALPADETDDEEYGC